MALMRTVRPHHLISGWAIALTMIPHATGTGSKVSATILFCGIVPARGRKRSHSPQTSRADAPAPARKAGSGLHGNIGWQGACFDIAPQQDQQLAGERHNRNASDPTGGRTHTAAEPDRQRTVRLVAHPQPGEFDQRLAGAGVARPW